MLGSLCRHLRIGFFGIGCWSTLIFGRLKDFECKFLNHVFLQLCSEKGTNLSSSSSRSKQQFYSRLPWDHLTSCLWVNQIFWGFTGMTLNSQEFSSDVGYLVICLHCWGVYSEIDKTYEYWWFPSQKLSFQLADSQLHHSNKVTRFIDSPGNGEENTTKKEG